MPSPVWSLDHVSLRGDERARLDDVTLEIPQGITAVMGCSGAGKSSLLSLLAGFEAPDSGIVSFHAQAEVPESPARLPLFWSPQDHGLWPHLTSIEHLTQVQSRGHELIGCDQLLEAFGLKAARNRLPIELSQGERSRLSVARSLASGASTLVFDEPLVHVDAVHLDDYWQVIEQHVQVHSSSIVFSTHHPATVLRYAENVICLEEGRVAFSGVVADLYHNPPSRELAWLLGPCNWLTDEVSAVIDVAAKTAISCPAVSRRAVRPERLLVECDQASSLNVVSVTPIGGLFDLQVEDVSKPDCRTYRLITSSSNVRICPGMRVRILHDRHGHTLAD